MRRSIVALVASAAVLASAAPTQAKGVVEATVCGKSECRTVTESHTNPFLSEGGQPTDPPASPAPWYRATMVTGAVGEYGRYTVVVVPDRRRLLGADGDWMPISQFAAAAYRKVMAGVEPLPAAELPGLPKRPVADEGGSSGTSLPWLPPSAALLLALLAAGALRLRGAKLEHRDRARTPADAPRRDAAIDAQH
jgi:hypothetical protein